MSVLARVIAASESLEVGDVDLGQAILVDLQRDIVAGLRRTFPCGCGQVFEWPGLREAHQLRGGCRASRAA